MDWRSPTVRTAVGVVATVVAGLVVVLSLLLAGGSKAVSDNAALIGALVALGGVFTTQMVNSALEDRRAREARELEVRRAHETALQKYFEQVGKLLIEKPLRRASPGDNLSTVVRAQTLTVLEGLEPSHKRILLQFLYESGLLRKDKPVVSLFWADLRGADLRGADLRGVNLSGARLYWAHMSGAHLSRANLKGAYMSEANLSEASLMNADVTVASLKGASLNGANLMEADVGGAVLSGASLIDATLIEADVQGADLSGADLSGADLSGADLSRADLSGTTGIEEGQLEQAKSLKGTTMPDGSKHP